MLGSLRVFVDLHQRAKRWPLRVSLDRAAPLMSAWLAITTKTLQRCDRSAKGRTSDFRYPRCGRLRASAGSGLFPSWLTLTGLLDHFVGQKLLQQLSLGRISFFQQEVGEFHDVLALDEIVHHESPRGVWVALLS